MYLIVLQRYVVFEDRVPLLNANFLWASAYTQLGENSAYNGKIIGIAYQSGPRSAS